MRGVSIYNRLDLTVISLVVVMKLFILDLKSQLEKVYKDALDMISSKYLIINRSIDKLLSEVEKIVLLLESVEFDDLDNIIEPKIRSGIL